MKELFDFVFSQHEKLLQQILTHLELVVTSVALASIVAIPLGIYLSRHSRVAGFFLGLTGTFQTIPSLALLGILIPLLGIGLVPALFALFIYALLPILSNTYTGIKQVDPLLSEAATAMGMNDFQKLVQIELPLALPVILAGVRTAAVINVGVATLAAYVGAGGLGEFIFGGISLNNPVMMLAGAIPAALLALSIDFILARLEKANFKQIGIVAIVLVTVIFGFSIYQYRAEPQIKGKKELLAGLTPEFIGRSDGWPGLERVYGLKMKNIVINDAIMYKAAQEKKLDVISGYSTDGRLRSYDLVILKDDKKVFPPYFAAPLVRKAVLKQFPELTSVFDKLKGSISDSEMVAMNYELDYLKKSPEEIAIEFLKKKRLYHASLSEGGRSVTLGAKIFGEQQILINIYSLMIRGYTHLSTHLKPNLGGTQICFAALTKGEIDMYPEYTGTALLVILKPPVSVSAKLMLNKDSLLKYVSRGLAKTYQLSYLDPIGFNNSYALMMRRKQASELGIQTISDLTRYTRK